MGGSGAHQWSIPSCDRGPIIKGLHIRPSPERSPGNSLKGFAFLYCILHVVCIELYVMILFF